MQITINDTAREIPFKLSLINLGQWVDYYKIHGKKLRSEFSKIKDRTYEGENGEQQRQIEVESYIDLMALSWFTYWSGFDFFSITDQQVQPILKEYRQLCRLFDSEDDTIRNFGDELQWKGETWCFSHFTDRTYQQMSFIELMIFKDVAWRLEFVGRNRWEYLPYLCAIFFRKKGESINDITTVAGGLSLESIINPERLELLMELPMNYAISIKYLLNTNSDLKI